MGADGMRIVASSLKRVTQLRQLLLERLLAFLDFSDK